MLFFLLCLSYKLHPQTTSQSRLIKIMGTKPCREKKPSLRHPKSEGITFSPQATLQGDRRVPPWSQSHPCEIRAAFINSAPSRAGKQFLRVIRSVTEPKIPGLPVGPVRLGCLQASRSQGTWQSRTLPVDVMGGCGFPQLLLHVLEHFETLGGCCLCPLARREGRTECSQPP